MAGLIITNGDAAADLLSKAGFEANILPWRDVLHDGPVPATDQLESLSDIRATFLADAFGLPLQQARDDMRERDRTLEASADTSGITLWFEHDLYDQLQLLQLLDFFHRRQRAAPIYLVQADDHLSQQTPGGLAALAGQKTVVTAAQMTLAADLFAAFRKPAPIDLASSFAEDLTPLPFMRAALKRLFEELPDRTTGLSRTQRRGLMLIEQRGLAAKRLFAAVQATEEAAFMGDWSFWRCLEELAFTTAPLLEGLPCRFKDCTADQTRQSYLDTELTLTDTGRAVLAGRADHGALNTIDRWFGGTHIAGDTLWRWDHEAACLVSPG